MSTKEILNENKTLIGLVGEKLIANYLTSLGHKIEFSLDPFAYSDLKIVEGDKKKKVQVKCVTPYFVKNEWRIAISETAQNIQNMVDADHVYLISLWTDKAKDLGIVKRSYDSCIVELFMKKLNDKDNSIITNNQRSLVIHREKDAHAYNIVRKLTQEELYITDRYPTSTLAV
jgi:hypothetical protein